ncbi:unnamed protein product [Ceutorhynchus assimilis]|uniref:RanBP2-type domain-containing protein n=1 Tax=Ceutorhynchus assimilis TaxID=467358 RepID=A0A9P0DDM8_9CUCU|nr:unnamed protein product [Ceutorhynchus assimilis]
MYAGTKPVRSSNVRVMQIFHELKAQFPTVPDHIITACITSHLASDSPGNLRDLVVATAAKDQQNHQMGRPSLQLDTSPFTTPTPIAADMSVSDLVKSETTTSDPIKNTSLAKRPNTLNINSDRKLQLSEKCRDVHKLLNSPILADKPPLSPLSVKRFAAKQVPKVLKKETVSTPTQTTDTLVNNAPLTSPSLNLSLNVNCQMGLVQSPTKPRCTTRVDFTPTQPWLNPNPFLPDPASPRSFTSVNLTLRQPTSTPQDPIDITSQNSSLTYSTSSFDKEKGLESRLQITVGPSGSVTSVRARPRSFHLGDTPRQEGEEDALRTGSLNNLAAINPEASVLVRQQARIDHMKIELRTDTARLVILRQEVEELEKKTLQVPESRTAEEIEKQLKLEIKHLTFQCEQLADRLDQNQFYNNIYSGPTGPLIAPRQRQSPRRPQGGRYSDFPDADDSRWNCSVCTFLNHPDLDKCEQCDMPRVFHVSAAPGDNIHIHVTPRLPRRIVHSWVL